jgi:hypothetical protein
MNNVEQAKLSRDAGLATFLNDNAAEYATNNAFIAIATKYATDYGILTGTVPAAGADNSGFNEEKLDNKELASAEAATLSASAQVQLDSLGMFSVSGKLHDAENYYFNVSDAESAGRLQGAHDTMNDNLPTLSPDYVTSGDLSAFQTLIDNFTKAQGTSESVHAISPAFTAQFKSALKVVDKDVVSILKLGKKMKISNPNFYTALVKQCKLPAVNVHHTTLHITIQDKTTGAPVAGGTITVSNTKKIATADTAGFGEIDELHDGNPTLNITAPGYTTYSSLIHIASGRENDYTIQLQRA